MATIVGDEGLTVTGDIVGTLRYMAPERFDGWSDQRSDVYGQGATLYELLALRPLYDNCQVRARLIERILHHELTSLVRCDPRIPPDLRTIVETSLAGDFDGNGIADYLFAESIEYSSRRRYFPHQV